MERGPALLLATLLGCGGRWSAGITGTDGEGEGTRGTEGSGGTEEASTTDGSTDGTGWDLGVVPDLPVPPDNYELDLVVVVDNSASMREEQRNVAEQLASMITILRESIVNGGNGPPPFGTPASVHVLITTTDLGGPLCQPVVGYSPAEGAPLTTSCLDRLDELEDPSVCTDVCAGAPLPEDPYLAWVEAGDEDESSNVPGGDVAGAFACLAVQGTVGCEQGQPLEAALRALDPAASWNIGDRPFLRETSSVAVLVISDEPDCSFEDPAIFSDPALMNQNPDTGQKEPSSAICWNAGVECEGPDPDGVYAGCHSVGDELWPVERYVERLRDELGAEPWREVWFMGVLGVAGPWDTTQGGSPDVVYRDWRDGIWPAGDLLPGDPESVAQKQWRYGIGPGCTAADDLGARGQATPPVRMLEVCAGVADEEGRGCCVASICDPYSVGEVLTCMTDWCSSSAGHPNRCTPPPDGASGPPR